MASCGMRVHTCLWVAFFILSAMGCNSPPQRLDPVDYTDDFGDVLGTEPVDEDTVGETQMLHRRARLEPYARAAIPLAEDNFDVGPALGLKAQIEVQKNLFVGLAFDWVHHESDDDISDAVNDDNLLDVDASEFYESMDRFNFLAVFDYEIELTDEFINPDSPLLLGLGLGAGLAIVTGQEADGRFISSFDIEPLFAFILRPAADLRWQVSETGFVTVGASFDWIPRDKIDIDYLGDRREVDDTIDFSTFNIGAGFMFDF